MHLGPPIIGGDRVPAGDLCVIEGAVADLALYGMGRRRADDRALRTKGTQAPEATAFKDYSPGPERTPRRHLSNRFRLAIH